MHGNKIFKKFSLLYAGELWMKIRWILGIFLPVLLSAQANFFTYFADSTLRIDYYRSGDAKTEMVTLDRMYLQTPWAGPRSKLIDPFNNGQYYIKVFDAAGQKLLFSRGYNAYFNEYQTTASAKKGIKRTYHETVLIPWPKKTVVVRWYSRNRKNILHVVLEQKIVPGTFEFSTENRAGQVEVIKSHQAGDVHRCVDIAFVGEGYRVTEREKFVKDLQRFTRILLNKKPFSAHVDQINVYGVFKPSEESGCDEPTHGIYRRTLLNCTFNSLGSPRYLLTEDNRTLHDVASVVPYDALIIMVNSARYGGGGIYNFYMDFTTDNPWSANVFIHEFGHSFAGLADEYYSSSTAYDDFYPQGIEPTEPNITRLLDPLHLKWQALVDSGVPIPTPWHKVRYDSLQTEYQEKRRAFNRQIAQLQKNGASKEKIASVQKQADTWSKQMVQRLKEILTSEKYFGKVGAFEGAGYVSQGMYRPMLDCVMFQNGDKPFCRVCAHRIEAVINHLSE